MKISDLLVPYIMPAIDASPNGGSIVIRRSGWQISFEELPLTGIVTAFDKLLESSMPLTRDNVAQWIDDTFNLKAFEGTLETALWPAKVPDLSTCLCVGWWTNADGAVVLDWSVVLPVDEVVSAAKIAIFGRQDAVYVINSGRCVSRNDMKSVPFAHAILGDIIAG